MSSADSHGGGGGDRDSEVPSHSSSAGAAATTQPKPGKPHGPVNELPPYNVILLYDNDHTYEYVVLMLRRVFGHPEERGFVLAKEVDEQGRAIVLTTHREHAELKRDQVLGFGADPRLATSRGSMSALIEPVE